MKGRSVIVVLLVAAVVTLYAVRAGVGWVGGVAYSRGRRVAATGAYEPALPLIERGAVGFHRPASLWFAGQARMGIWQDLRGRAAESTVDSAHLLTEAYRDYTAAISMSPASGWYWAALADLYQQQERSERFDSGVSLDLLGADRWSFVGRPGRVAVGMNRMAIRREPNVYVLHDQLAFVLLYHALQDEALVAVRHSARAQPIYHFHKYRNMVPVPPELVETFLEASRGSLGKTPFLRRVTHLIWLARLEIELGRYEDAVADLRAALEERGQEIWSPAAHFYLGRALAGLERYGEAEEALRVSERNPSFEARSVIERARIARSDGRLEDSLGLYRRVRRLQPGVVGHALEYARTARRLESWDLADEALRWAATIAPADRRVPVELLECRLARGDLPGAREALATLRRIEGTDDLVRRYGDRIEKAEPR